MDEDYEPPKDDERIDTIKDDDIPISDLEPLGYTTFQYLNAKDMVYSAGAVATTISML